MIRVITLDREYGSGGPAIAQRLADRLGWALWDERLTREIARLTECDPAVVAGREERGDPMYYRLFKSFLRGSFEGNLQAQRLKPVDADRILEVTGHVVRGAGAAGNCVIVGRGSAYFLRDRADAYHVFVYAPFDEKIRRERRAGRSEFRFFEILRRDFADDVFKPLGKYSFERAAKKNSACGHCGDASVVAVDERCD